MAAVPACTKTPKRSTTFTINLANSPTRIADRTVPSRTPMSSPAQTSPMPAAIKESVTSLTIFTEPKDLRVTAAAASTKPSPGWTIVFYRICMTIPSARTKFPEMLIRRPVHHPAGACGETIAIARSIQMPKMRTVGICRRFQSENRRRRSST